LLRVTVPGGRSSAVTTQRGTLTLLHWGGCSPRSGILNGAWERAGTGPVAGDSEISAGSTQAHRDGDARREATPLSLTPIEV